MSGSPSAKGQIEVSFNWIFVLIAGAAILLFFFIFINREQGTQEEVLNREVTDRISTLLAAVEKTSKSVQVLNKLNFEMEFSCEGESQIYYTIRNSEFRSYPESELVFPSRVIGNSIPVAWIENYAAPYPIGSLLLFSDQNTQYVFISKYGDGYVGWIQEMYENFPIEFSKNNISISELSSYSDKGFRNYVFITKIPDAYYGTLNVHESIRRKYTILIMEPDDTALPYSSGLITFNFNVPSRQKSIPYVGSELANAAIITGDPELYECSLNKVMAKKRIIDTITIKRIELLRERYTLYDRCWPFYQENPLINAITSSSLYSEDLDLRREDMQTEIGRIASINTQLLRVDCPFIY